MKNIILHLALFLTLCQIGFGQLPIAESEQMDTKNTLNSTLNTNSSSLYSRIPTDNGSRRTGIYQKGYSQKVKKLYRSKYYITESAFMPDPGQLYFENKMYLMIGAGIGITKFLSIETNALINPVGLPPLIPNVSLKLGHSFRKVIHAAFKVNISGDTEYNDFYRGYATGCLTVGNPEMNLTVAYNRIRYAKNNYNGVGYTIKNESGVSIAASVDVLKRSNFKIEHIYFPSQGGYIMVGLGSSWEHFSLNYGLWLPLLRESDLYQFTAYDYNFEIPGPYISFIVAIADIIK